MKEIARFNIPDLCLPAIQKLYKLIEIDFNPLEVAYEVQECLKEIAVLNRSEYCQYANAIRLSVATKVLKQITAIYETLTLERFNKIIPFYTPAELERFLVDVSKHKSVKVFIFIYFI